jgi:hypothetical protein
MQKLIKHGDKDNRELNQLVLPGHELFINCFLPKTQHTFNLQIMSVSNVRS